MTEKNKKGFTLVELLVVIAIIGILTAVISLGLNVVRGKARDGKRASDMSQIKGALDLFYDQNGCLPQPGSSICATGDSNAGGWDYSSQGAFLPFLQAAGYFTAVPVDPINNMTGDGTPGGSKSYRYYCYTSWYANPGLHLGYWKENGDYVHVIPPPESSLWTDPRYGCQ